jgi:hypothetical protein
MSGTEEKARAELVTKLRALSKARGYTTSGELFRAFDGDHDGALQAGELRTLLAAADVGSGLTRGIYVSKIMDRLDTSKSKGLDLAELNGVLRELDPPPPPATGTPPVVATVPRPPVAAPTVERTVPFESMPAETEDDDQGDQGDDENALAVGAWLIVGAFVFWLVKVR